MAKSKRPEEEKENKKGILSGRRSGRKNGGVDDIESGSIEEGTSRKKERSSSRKKARKEKKGRKSGKGSSAAAAGFSADTVGGVNIMAQSAAFSAASAAPEKKHRLRLPKISRKAGRGAGAEAASDTEGGFGATIRSAEPILKLSGESGKKAWMKDLKLNISFAALITAVVCLFPMAVDEPFYVLTALPCAAVFLIISMIESLKPGKLKWIIAAVIAVILIVVFAIFHSRIAVGLAMLANMFYEYCEDAQAYVYTRYEIGYTASVTDSRIGFAWLSALIGLIAALPPKSVRKSLAVLITLAAMFAFAYYGLIPSWACLTVIGAALVICISRGGLLSVMPIVLLTLIIFGALYWFDPGESYTISRIDENLRDRFALRTAQLESMFTDEYMDPMDDTMEDEWDTPEDQTADDNANDTKGKYGKYVVIGFVAILLVALVVSGFLIFRRIANKRRRMRAGLDSSDPRTAVVAMFPYSVRWLVGYGLEQTAEPFPEMLPAIKSEFSDEYARRYSSMYELWSEAAYSDHEVRPDTVVQMDKFMQDTIKMVDKRCSFRDKLRIKFKYAL